MKESDLLKTKQKKKIKEYLSGEEYSRSLTLRFHRHMLELHITFDEQKEIYKCFVQKDPTHILSTVIDGTSKAVKSNVEEETPPICHRCGGALPKRNETWDKVEQPNMKRVLFDLKRK
ncbi:hypothetical protein P3S67_000618 [Capsicum chacoense]|uniref:uncharacterized protein LOC107842822 n=1 Tax=Capsicum annuum TaxID=4072 RepID=UPI0007BF849E|nr:uncharacterized protein LOC107842822 [Capsicum annuum]KAF3653430.1 hypothetical protein FXO38_15642 [Capsicum annuum]